jgi:hypothetical protein
MLRPTARVADSSYKEALAKQLYVMTAHNATNRSHSRRSPVHKLERALRRCPLLCNSAQAQHDMPP